MIGSAVASMGFTCSLNNIFKTQESGDDPKISPLSETAPIELYASGVLNQRTQSRKNNFHAHMGVRPRPCAP